MSSPYIPKTSDEYLANLISWMQSRNSRITNFKPGSRSRTLLEAVSLQLARSDVDYYQFYRQAIRLACYLSFGFDLLPGNKSFGFVRVYHTGHLVAFPVPVFSVNIGGLRYTTAAPSSIPFGNTYVDVDIQADEPGTQYNIDPLVIDTDQGRGDIETGFGQDRIANTLIIDGGTDQETEQQREARFQDFINNLARSTLLGIRGAVKAIPGIVDLYIVENINPYSFVAENGWIDIYITDGSVSPPPSLLTEVQKVVDGDPLDPINYPGYRAAGTRSFIGTITVLAVTMTYDIDVLASTLLTDPEIENIANTAISNYVNGLSQGNDVLHQKTESVGLQARPDFYRIRNLLINGFATDLSIAGGVVPKIGGPGGGTITCSSVTRMNPL